MAIDNRESRRRQTSSLVTAAKTRTNSADTAVEGSGTATTPAGAITPGTAWEFSGGAEGS